MNSFSLDDVRHVAKLALLYLTSEEETRFASQLSAILAFISKLQQVDTKNVEPTFQTTGLTNVFREDEVDATRMLSQEDALANAKETHNGFFMVPAVLEE